MTLQSQRDPTGRRFLLALLLAVVLIGAQRVFGFEQWISSLFLVSLNYILGVAIGAAGFLMVIRDQAGTGRGGIDMTPILGGALVFVGIGVFVLPWVQHPIAVAILERAPQQGLNIVDCVGVISVLIAGVLGLTNRR